MKMASPPAVIVQAFNHTVTGIGEMHVREHAVVGGQKDPPNPLVQ